LGLDFSLLLLATADGPAVAAVEGRPAAIPPDPGPESASAVCLPIDSQGRTHGLILGHRRAPRQFTAEDAALCQVYLRRAARRLDNARRPTPPAADREHLRTLVNASPDAIFFKDGQGRWLEANPAGLALFQLQGVAYQGKTNAELAAITPAYREVLLARQALDDKAWRLGAQVRSEETLPLPDGGEKIFDIIKVPIFNGDGSRRGLVTIWRDITERKRNEAQLRLTAQVFNSSAEGIMITDANNRLVSVNPAFTDITGYSAEESLGKKPNILIASRHDAAFYREIWAAVQEHGLWRGEVWNRRRNGEIYPQWITITALRNSAGAITHYIGCFSDLSKEKLAESRIYHLAHHDVLTNLPNRSLLLDRLNQALAQAARHQRKLALLLVDLDRFKVINDTLGHAVGDQLLQGVAARISGCVRSEDTVARPGGDEFVILLSDIHQEQDAAFVAQKIIDVLTSCAFTFYQHELHIEPSVGISIYPHDGGDAETLMKNADTAMYHAKKHGGNTYQFYAAEMNAAAVERLALESSLRHAIDRGELLLYYQPQMELASGRLLGMEALIRWQHPHRGLVPPARFIPVAEEVGLILPIGEWVLRQACQQHRRWQEAGYGPVRVAVNLSARQFRQGTLLEVLTRILRETAMPPSLLELELTEGMLMQHTQETVETLRALNRLGIRITIDDFGIGYSSLSYLKRFPIHKLKVDRSFVRDITVDPDDAAIVSAIIAMAHGLKLNVIAEGVETAEQLTFLRQQQCDAIQGFYYSPPLPADALVRLLPPRP
ncbi:MAG: EAL domain-containing protein, partial [Pseudomonadota bacterium]|nr:EAL domain-containing protein [Pseudomonadota bacterium]